MGTRAYNQTHRNDLYLRQTAWPVKRESWGSRVRTVIRPECLDIRQGYEILGRHCPNLDLKGTRSGAEIVDTTRESSGDISANAEDEAKTPHELFSIDAMLFH
jgi:hypothetical protein